MTDIEKVARPDAAIENLTHHQQQADMDGTFVKVSRQALDEVLSFIAAMQPVQQEPVGSAAEITRLTEALREADENINLKADFIDATINQLAAKDQDIYELKEALRAAEEREKGLREFVEMFVKLARLGTGDKPVARSGRVNVSSDMLYIAKSLVGPLHDA